MAPHHPERLHFWLSNERLKKKKTINVAEQDKKKEPYSKSVSHSLHIPHLYGADIGSEARNQDCILPEW